MSKLDTRCKHCGKTYGMHYGEDCHMDGSGKGFVAREDSAPSTKSPLVQLVEAFEQLQRVQQYLYASTYASDGMGSMSWAHWYDDIASAVEILRTSEHTLRYIIARTLGATLNK
jgi:hypothetical protein